MSGNTNNEKSVNNQGDETMLCDDGFIKLKVAGQDGNEIHFRVKKTTLMGKLKKSYAEKMGVEVQDLRFLFEGQSITDEHTPKELELEQDNIIEVFSKMEGGGDCKY